MKPSTFKHIEAELAAYHDTQKEIERKREEIMNPTMTEELVGGRSSEPSDPTGRIATRLVSDKRLNELERIERIIREVYDSLEPGPKRMVQLKYWSRPQTRTWEGISMELHVHRATAFRWRDEIVKAIADKLGWS
jgi:RinA family phage transcriptional activator